MTCSVLNQPSRSFACVAAIVALASSAPVSGQSPLETIVSDAEAGANLGYAVDIDGDTLLVGAFRDDAVGADSGAAYVFRWNGTGWTEEAKLVASDTTSSDFFGISVALDGDTAIIGARFQDGAAPDAGAAYIFTRSGTTWTEQAKIKASDAAGQDSFGISVDIDGDTAIVGAHYDDGTFGMDQGAAYVFTRTGASWTEQAKLAASDGVAADWFGVSVSLHGDTALVGAPQVDGPGGADSGGAYVFTRAGSVWTERVKILPADGAAGDRFGTSGDLESGTAVIGAYGDADAGAFTGSAYVFTGSGATWTEQDKLMASDGIANDYFGIDVAISGDTVLVGANRSGGTDTGAAYAFVRSGLVWTEQQKLTAPDPGPGDWFGAAVSISGDTALIGAYLSNGAAGNDQGSAYVFERFGTEWMRPDARVIALDGDFYDNFGYAVDISGDTAVVGVFLDDDAGDASGSAYIFTRSGSAWIEQTKLLRSDPASGDQFGISVAISGDTVIVGADSDNPGGTDSGSAYVFTRSGSIWTQQAKLTPLDAAAFDYFGGAVDIDGDTAIVGASLDDEIGGADQGSAYVFTRVGGVWTQQAKLTASDGAAGDYFGAAVAVDTDTAIVGAYRDFAGGVRTGSAYAFKRVGAAWSQEAKLTSFDGAEDDYFGFSVALEGETTVIGAFRDDHGAASDQGSASVFTRIGGAWFEQAKLIALDAGSGDNFGRSVSLEGDTVIVGSYRDNDAALNAGAVYLFTRWGDVWAQQAKFVAPDGADYDYLGVSVALSGATMIAGAFGDDDIGGEDQGAARFFDVPTDAFPLVSNVTRSTSHDSFSSAFPAATPEDLLFATPTSYWFETPIDSGATPVTLQSTGEIRLPHTSAMTVSSQSLYLSDPTSDIHLYGDASVELDGALMTGATLQNRGSLSLLGGSISATTLLNESMVSGAGGINADTTNEDQFIVQADLNHYGDYTNNGVTTIQNGTLTILGTLMDNGTIVGDFATTRAEPGGFFVEGDYSAGADASLLLTGGLAKFGGDVDIAINDNTRFDMAASEVRLVGLEGATQTLEVMSADVGPVADGLDGSLPGQFPIGTLRIGPAGTTVNLVDIRDNDGLGTRAPEALYVTDLVIDVGATLNTNGSPVYYESLTNNGSVDNPGNLIQIAACVADLTGDGVVDGADLAALLSQWGGAGSGDLTGDGNVDGADLAAMLAAWGACS